MKIIAATLLLAAGLAAAVMLTFPAVADAWDLGALPSGCAETGHNVTNNADGSHTYSYILVCGSAQTTLVYGDQDYPSPPSNPTFQDDLDAFVNANCPSCAATTTAATDTVPPGSPPPPPTDTTVATTTVEVTTTVTDPIVDQRLTALEQRQTVDEARITALEANAGLIVGEPKNVAPFTDTAG